MTFPDQNTNAQAPRSLSRTKGYEGKQLPTSV